MESFAWPTSHAASDEPKVAIILPGAAYTVQAPLLFWVAAMLVDFGWHVQAVRWNIDDAARRDPHHFVASAAEQAFADAPPAQDRLIVAKSLGTLCIPWAEETGIAGLWLTPLLTDAQVRATLESTSKHDLLIGGSKDDAWDGGRKKEGAGTYIEIPGADHGLRLPGDWRASLEVHRKVLTHAEDFITAI